MIYRSTLSLLVSNLSSISSKAPVPIRAPPEKGCSMAPMVNGTSPCVEDSVVVGFGQRLRDLFLGEAPQQNHGELVSTI